MRCKQEWKTGIFASGNKFRINDDISALAADDYAEQCVVSSDCEDVTDIIDDNDSDSDYDFHDDLYDASDYDKSIAIDVDNDDHKVNNNTVHSAILSEDTIGGHTYEKPHLDTIRRKIRPTWLRL